jgi:hypothetical protein
MFSHLQVLLPDGQMMMIQLRAGETETAFKARVAKAATGQYKGAAEAVPCRPA